MINWKEVEEGDLLIPIEEHMDNLVNCRIAAIDMSAPKEEVYWYCDESEMEEDGQWQSIDSEDWKNYRLCPATKNRRKIKKALGLK